MWVSNFFFFFQNTCFNDGVVNLIQFLQEIATEQQFEVTYVDIEEKSSSGKLQTIIIKFIHVLIFP